MKYLPLVYVLLISFPALSQQQNYDLFSFTPPKMWNKVIKESGIIFSTVDDNKQTWAQIDIIKSTASKGSIDEDFKSEWKELVKKRYGVRGEPLLIDSQNFQGWKLYTGLARFEVKSDTASLLLNTFSDGSRCASFILISNTKGYGSILDEFVGSINLSKPNASQVNKDDLSKINEPQLANNFQFHTTNFDDGWTSIEKENWVELIKDNIKVLLHYPRAEDSEYYTQHHEKINLFWNLLVAPRYSNLRNYEAPGSNLPESAYLASGMLRDNDSGNDVWVTLFSKGKSGWMEIITPDRASFVKAFGIDNPHAYFTEWDPLIRLAGMNRFAVGEKDLIGKWSNEFQGSTSYYNTYTGIYTGSTTFASRQNFIFKNQHSYHWDLSMANGATGTTMKVDQANASGTWKMLNNWQIWFSDIERTPKTYNAYFSCFKGGRILWLQDVSYGSYTAYGKISQ